MKKLSSIMQQIISIALIYSYLHGSPAQQQELAQLPTIQENLGQSIQNALTIAWKLATTTQDHEKRDLIAKAMDDFRELMSTYKKLVTQQPKLEQKVAHTVTILQQQLTSAERKLRTTQTQEADLATTQAEVQRKAVEIDDLRKELRTLQDENNRLRNQVTLLFHEQGIINTTA